jgi:hypothetical protein
MDCAIGEFLLCIVELLAQSDYVCARLGSLCFLTQGILLFRSVLNRTAP